MKRPLRYRTMGAVREGRGNPSPYSIPKDCLILDLTEIGKLLNVTKQKPPSKLRRLFEQISVLAG